MTLDILEDLIIQMYYTGRHQKEAMKVLVVIPLHMMEGIYTSMIKDTERRGFTIVEKGIPIRKMGETFTLLTPRGQHLTISKGDHFYINKIS